MSRREPVRRRTGCPSVPLSPDFWLPAFGDAGLRAADIEQHDRATDSRPGTKFELLAVPISPDAPRLVIVNCPPPLENWYNEVTVPTSPRYFCDLAHSRQ